MSPVRSLTPWEVDGTMRRSVNMNQITVLMKRFGELTG